MAHTLTSTVKQLVFGGDTGAAGGVRFLLRDTVFYGIASAAVRFTMLLVTPIVARKLTTTDYGVLDTALLLLTILVVGSVFGQDSAVARHFVEAGTLEARRDLVSTGLWMSAATALLFCAVVLLGADGIGRTWLGRSDVGHVYRLAALAVPPWVLNQHFINLLKWTFRRRTFLIVTLATAGLTVAGVLWFVVVWKMGVVGVLLAHIVAQSVGCGLGALFCADLVRFRFARTQAPGLLAFGWPYALLGIGGVLMIGLDRVFVARQLSAVQLGAYAAGVKTAALMTLVTSGFQMAWGPFAFSIFKRPEASTTFRMVLLLYAGSLLALAVTLSTFSSVFVRLLVSERYLDGQVVVGILALATTLSGIQWVTGVGVSVAKRTYLIAAGYAGGLALGVTVLALLVPRLGMRGAALGTLSIQVGSTLLVTWFAQRIHPYDYDFRSLALMVVTGSTCIGLQTMMPLPVDWWSWLIRLVVGGLAVVVVLGLLLTRYSAALAREQHELLQSGLAGSHFPAR